MWSSMAGVWRARVLLVADLRVHVVKARSAAVAVRPQRHKAQRVVEDVCVRVCGEVQQSRV